MPVARAVSGRYGSPRERALLGRELNALGHRVKLTPPGYLKAYAKQQERFRRCGSDLRGSNAALDAVRAGKGHRAIRVDAAPGAWPSSPATHDAGQCIARSHGRIRDH